MPKASSPAVVELIQEVEAAGGKPPTPTQIKGWVEAGALQPPEQSHEKGRKGSRSEFPPGAAARVIKIQELLGTPGIRLPLRILPALLFADGEDIDEDIVRRSYLQLVDFIEPFLDPLVVSTTTGSDLDDPGELILDAASTAADKFLRRTSRSSALQRWRLNLEEVRTHPRTHLEQILQFLFTSLGGGTSLPDLPDLIPDLAVIAGGPSLWPELAAEFTDPDDQEQIRAAVAFFRPANLREVAERLHYRAYDRGRQPLAEFVQHLGMAAMARGAPDLIAPLIPLARSTLLLWFAAASESPQR